MVGVKACFANRQSLDLSNSKASFVEYLGQCGAVKSHHCCTMRRHPPSTQDQTSGASSFLCHPCAESEDCAGLRVLCACSWIAIQCYSTKLYELLLPNFQQIILVLSWIHLLNLMLKVLQMIFRSLLIVCFHYYLLVNHFHQSWKLTNCFQTFTACLAANISFNECYELL